MGDAAKASISCNDQEEPQLANFGSAVNLHHADEVSTQIQPKKIYRPFVYKDPFHQPVVRVYTHHSDSDEDDELRIEDSDQEQEGLPGAGKNVNDGDT